MELSDQIVKNQNVIDIEEIINTLMQINQILMDLKDCSSNDFLNFSVKLKEYHQKGKLISDNTTKLLEFASGSKNTDFLSELDHAFSLTKQKQISFDELTRELTKALSSIENNLDMLFIPIKNFRQNLITLRYLDTNINLKFNYKYPEDFPILGKHRNAIHELNEQIKPQILEIEENLRNLKILLKEIISSFLILKESFNMHLDSVLFDIQFILNNLQSKQLDMVFQVPKFHEKSKNYQDSIQKIIVSIQYQDIISQKMTHIQSIHNLIIQELSELTTQDPQQDTISKLLFKVRDIVSLQMSQLIRNNKDYESAIETISLKFSDIGNDLHDIAQSCYVLTSHLYNSGNSSKYINIVEILDTNAEVFLKLSAESLAFESNIHSVYKRLAMLYSKISEFGSFDEQINAINEQLSNQGSKLENLDEKLLEVVNRIQMTLLEIGSNHKVIKSQIEEFEFLRVHFERFANSFSGSEFNLFWKQQSEKTLQIKDEYLKVKNKTSELLLENSEIANQISEQVKSSIQNVAYYETFERLIEEIISKLKFINEKIENSFQINMQEKSTEHLEKLKSNYTVKSEYSIHNEFVNSQHSSVSTESASADTDDDVELF